MIFNLVLSLWGIGRGDRAQRVAEHALTRPRDHTTDRCRVWARFSAALAGDVDRAADEMRALPGGPIEMGLAHLAEALELATSRDEDVLAPEEEHAVAASLSAADAVARAEPALCGPIDATRERIATLRPTLRW